MTGTLSWKAIFNHDSMNTSVQKKNLHYVLDQKGHIKKYKPWLGDVFSFLYDRIMEKFIFPRKFNASLEKHIDILKNESRDIHHARILEIATGSGNAALFLNKNNNYTGIDISPGLLKRAYSRFNESGFEMVELYVSTAEDLPFPDHLFDLALCHLSLNFFSDIELFIRELKRVLKHKATFFETSGSNFRRMPHKNGAILYFTANLCLG